MTNRERWTVYPLLFFAMALGFRSNYRNPLEFRSRQIECNSLVVRGNADVGSLNGRDAETLISRTHEIWAQALSDAAAAVAEAVNQESTAGATEAAAEQPAAEPRPDVPPDVESDRENGTLPNDEMPNDEMTNDEMTNDE